MAPRGRTSKPRESRMDAAVDAMKKFGFKEKRVKHTVKELLKVYGGAEAWPLIEDECYGTLFEILLKENQEKEGGDEQNKSTNKEGANQVKQTMVSATPFCDITDNASGRFPENAGMEEFQAAPPTILPPPPPVGTTANRRKPFYGWISDSDDDDEGC